MELNKIYNENNLSTLKRMPDNFLDLVVTSPPYDDMDEDFIPIPKKGLRDYNGYTWDFKGIVDELYRTLKPGGVVVWVVNDPTIKGSESLASSYQKIYFRKVGFNVHDTMIWNKKANGAVGSQLTYWQSFEYMFIFTKGKPNTVNRIRDHKNKDAGKRNQSKRRKTSGNFKELETWITPETSVRANIWQINTGWMHSYKEEYLKGHPAIFPEQLVTDHILSWSNEGDIVYDPFMGSGTVAKCCKLLNRYYIGSEISSEYVEIAEKRVRETIVPII